MARTFSPWVGERYQSEGLDGLRLLILGESHYGKFGTEGADKTQSVVRAQGRGERYRLFTVTAKLVLNRGRGHISDAERAEFWDRVAFANYIQSFVAESAEARDRPSEEMWDAAKEPFLSTVKELRPNALLVLGQELSTRLPSLPSGIQAYAINHPSRYLKYATWQKPVQEFLAAARAV